jgi:hypothetical protein
MAGKVARSGPYGKPLGIGVPDQHGTICERAQVLRVRNVPLLLQVPATFRILLPHDEA